MVELVPEKLKKKINDSFSLNKVEKVFYKLDLQRKIKIFVNEFLQIPTEPFGKELAILQTHELFQHSKADKEAAAYNIEGLDTEKIKTAILKLNFIKVWPYYQRMNILFPYLIKYVGNSKYENINKRIRLFSQIKNEIFIICKNKGFEVQLQLLNNWWFANLPGCWPQTRFDTSKKKCCITKQLKRQSPLMP